MDGLRTPSLAATRATVTASSPSASATSQAAATTESRVRPRRLIPAPRGRSPSPSPRPDPPPRGRGRPPAAAARAPAATARSRAPSGRCHVAMCTSGNRQLRAAAVATPPSDVNASPAISVPSRLVEEGDVAGRVAGRGDHLQRADPLARLEQAGRPGRRSRVAAAHLCVGRLAGIRGHVLLEQARVAARDQHLSVGQRRRQVVEPAHVVAVGMGERDPHDRRPQSVGRGQDRPRAALADGGVDQREAVLLADQVGVDEAEAGDARECGCLGHWSSLR